MRGKLNTKQGSGRLSGERGVYREPKLRGSEQGTVRVSGEIGYRSSPPQLAPTIAPLNLVPFTRPKPGKSYKRRGRLPLDRRVATTTHVSNWSPSVVWCAAWQPGGIKTVVPRNLEKQCCSLLGFATKLSTTTAPLQLPKLHKYQKSNRFLALIP